MLGLGMNWRGGNQSSPAKGTKGAASLSGTLSSGSLD
jgi:hypothetical protein